MLLLSLLLLLLLLLAFPRLGGALVPAGMSTALCGPADGQLRPFLLVPEAVSDGKELHGLVEVFLPDVRFLHAWQKRGISERNGAVKTSI